MKSRFILTLVGVLFAASWPAQAAAQDRTFDKILTESKQVFTQFMKDESRTIPHEVLQRAEAVVIYPTVIHGGFLLGARYGKGVLIVHDKENRRWSEWSFTTLRGGSAGAQMGIQALDMIFVIMNKRGLQGFLDQHFELGIDATVLAGPIGEHVEMGTDFWQGADLLSYISKRGFFGGLSLGGTLIAPNRAATKSYDDTAGLGADLLRTLNEITYTAA